jgi:hypothetical protein
VKNSETEISRCLVARVSAVARRPLVIDLGADRDGASTFVGSFSDFDDTNLSLELFRRSAELSGSSIWFPFPFTTRSERFELFFLDLGFFTDVDFLMDVFLRALLVLRFVFVAMLLLSRSHENIFSFE